MRNDRALYCENDHVVCPHCRSSIATLARDLFAGEIVCESMFIFTVKKYRANDATTCWKCGGNWMKEDFTLEIDNNFIPKTIAFDARDFESDNH